MSERRLSEHTDIHTASETAHLSAYIKGFGFSLILTLVAYFLAVHHLLTKNLLIAIVVALALTQFIVQLIYFLQLGRETKPRWKLIVFIFMITIVVIIVGGSLWIMSNLNYHMTSAQVNSYLHNQDGL